MADFANDPPAADDGQLRPRYFWLTGDSRLSHHRMIMELIAPECREALWKGLALPSDTEVPAKLIRYRRLEDMAWGTDVPVVSERFRNLISPLVGENVQFLKVRLIGATAEGVEAAFWAMNCTNILDCHDEQRSAFHPKDPNRLRALYLDQSKIPDATNIFRVRHMESKLVVAEVVRRVIQDAGFTGAQFFQPEADEPLGV